MVNRILLCLFGIVAFLSLGIGLYSLYTRPKIAYVRSHDLVSNYAGTKEALKNLETKKISWKSNIDTLSQGLQKALAQYNRDSKLMNALQKTEREKQLALQREQLVNYSNAIEEKAHAEDEKAMKGVLNQVNSFIENFGRDNGYDIIVGTTLSGNVLYGEKQIDITDAILKSLNESYRGGVKN
jgi:outer membrane protein